MTTSRLRLRKDSLWIEIEVTGKINYEEVSKLIYENLSGELYVAAKKIYELVPRCLSVKVWEREKGAEYREE